MNEKTIITLSILDGVIMMGMAILLILILAEVRHDPLDVNRDGESNIVDLSVLSFELNERGQK